MLIPKTLNAILIITLCKKLETDFSVPVLLFFYNRQLIPWNVLQTSQTQNIIASLNQRSV